MAVHLIFCRIIAEVVRPLPPSVRRHPPRHRSLATPVILLFVLPPRCPAPVGRVDERGRALCLTFCKNCPPPRPPLAPHTSAATTAITSASSSSSSRHLFLLHLLLMLRLLSSSFSPTPPLFNSSLSRLSYGVLLYTLGCAARRYIVLSRRRISNMMDARGHTVALDFLFLFLFLFFLPFRTRRTRRCAIANSERKGAQQRPQLVA